MCKKENIRYEIEQETILGFLKMDKQQVSRFIEIMRNKRVDYISNRKGP